MRPDLKPETPFAAMGRLAEECGEVIVEIGHTMRFGSHARDPETGVEYNNLAALVREMDDLESAIADARYQFTKLSGEWRPEPWTMGADHERTAPVEPPKQADWQQPVFPPKQVVWIRNPKSREWREILEQWRGK